MAEPLIPLLAGDTAAVPRYLEQQAGLLRAAHRAADPVAATLLRATGLGAEPLARDLPLETARQAVARDHGYADWAVYGGHEPVAEIIRAHVSSCGGAIGIDGDGARRSGKHQHAVA